MSFPNGYYIIKHQRSGKIVARHLVEDRSLLPKKVLVLPDGLADPSNFIVSYNEMIQYLC